MKTAEIKPSLSEYCTWIWFNTRGWLRKLFFWVAYLDLPRRTDYKENLDFSRAEVFAGRINFLIRCNQVAVKIHMPFSFSATKSRLRKLMAYREGWACGVSLKDHLFMKSLDQYSSSISQYELYQKLVAWDTETAYHHWSELPKNLRNSFRESLLNFRIFYYP